MYNGEVWAKNVLKIARSGSILIEPRDVGRGGVVCGEIFAVLKSTAQKNAREENFRDHTKVRAWKSLSLKFDVIPSSTTSSELSRCIRR